MTSVQRVVAGIKGAIATIVRNFLLVVVTFAILVVATLFFVNHLQKQYVAAANLLVVNGTTRDDPTLSNPDLPAIASGSVVLGRTKAALKLDTPLIDLKRHLSIKSPAYKSSIIRLEFTDANPDRAVRITNGIADELAQYYRQVSTTRYDADLAALDAEMGRERTRAMQTAAALHARGGDTATIGSATDNTADVMGARLNDLETQRALAAAALTGDRSRLDSLRIQKNTVNYEILHNDPVYQQLATSESASEAALATARAQFTENYPGMPALQTKTDSLKGALKSEASRALTASNAYSPTLSANHDASQAASALLEADKAKVAALDGLLDNQRERANTIPKLQALRLDHDAAQAAYLAIAARRATALANRADALSLGSLTIVDRAIASDAAAGIQRGMLAALLLAFSLALAIAAAFIAEGLNPRLRRATQIEELYGHPVVATLGKK
jgi:uncharacterized protein involved in exopolysaccharide biosynthesis